MDSSSEPPSPEPLTVEGNNINSLLDELEDDINDDSLDGDVGKIKRKFMSVLPEDEEFNSSQVPIDTISRREVLNMIESIPKPLLQKPIQPGSTPADEDNRFLCWNNTGIIRAQKSSEDQSIDITFHDTEKHSSVNFRNGPNYTFGSLSEDCIVVGTNGQYSTGPASIHGVNLQAKDRDNREWDKELPHVELIEALAVGSEFVAVATDRGLIRLFTNVGMRLDKFDSPGHVLCMSASGQKLMLICHNGAGHPDEQNLSMHIYCINPYNDIPRRIHKSENVPLSKRSPLAWAGFSDEGSPCTYDYSGVLRIFTHGMWKSILDLRELTSSALDHYFVVGLNELSQTVRAVKCKRSRFPVFTADTTEMISINPAMGPTDTDQDKLEEQQAHLRRIKYDLEQRTKQDPGNSLIETALEANEKQLVNNTLRLFATYLKEDNEDMAEKLVYVMPKSHMSKLAEFAWKVNRPQHFIDTLNRMIEEREQLGVIGNGATLANSDDEDDEDVQSISSGQHSSGRGLKRELDKQSSRAGNKQGGINSEQTSPNKLKPLPFVKVVENNVNRILDSSSTQKRQLAESSFDEEEESGDENDVKRAKKRSKTSTITYNLFSKKTRA